MRVQSLGWEDPLEEEMATHSGISTGLIPQTEEPIRLQFMGSQESQTGRRNWACTHTHAQLEGIDKLKRDLYLYFALCNERVYIRKRNLIQL